MNFDEVNKLFSKILKTQDKFELRKYATEVENLVKKNSLHPEDVMQLQLALHTKENEMAIFLILEMINTISASEDTIGFPQMTSGDKDKLH